MGNAGLSSTVVYTKNCDCTLQNEPPRKIYQTLALSTERSAAAHIFKDNPAPEPKAPKPIFQVPCTCINNRKQDIKTGWTSIRNPAQPWTANRLRYTLATEHSVYENLQVQCKTTWKARMQKAAHIIIHPPGVKRTQLTNHMNPNVTLNPKTFSPKLETPEM